MIARTLKPISSACLLLLATGCGSANRHPLAGTVTLDGQPLETGVIQFIPAQETKGPSAGGHITDGKFRVDSDHGIVAGNYRVEITSVRKTGRKIRTTWGEMTDEQQNLIPFRYNRDSELTAEVAAEGGGTFDFAVKSK